MKGGWTGITGPMGGLGPTGPMGTGWRGPGGTVWKGFTGLRGELGTVWMGLKDCGWRGLGEGGTTACGTRAVGDISNSWDWVCTSSALMTDALKQRRIKMRVNFIFN